MFRKERKGGFAVATCHSAARTRHPKGLSTSKKMYAEMKPTTTGFFPLVIREDVTYQSFHKKQELCIIIKVTASIRAQQGPPNRRPLPAQHDTAFLQYH